MSSSYLELVFSVNLLHMPGAKSKFRLNRHRILMAAASVLLFAQIVALWPSSMENRPDAEPTAPPTGQTEAAPEAVFPGFEPPGGADPDYGIEGFHYISVLKGLKQWLLDARQADFYSKEQWVYARDVKAQLYSDDQSNIEVRGDFARYSMVTRNLDLGGRVVARFPDGTELRTELLEFRPSQRKVGVPLKYKLRGKGPSNAPALLEFESLGMDGTLPTGSFILNRQVSIRVKSHNPRQAPTEIQAPHATYRRFEGLMELGPAGEGPSAPTRLQQGGLKASAHTMEIRLAAGSKKASFIARNDVKIEGWRKSGGRSTPDRYSTCGRAEFDPEKQEIVLGDYPQVYQDGDTMTGEVIRILRQLDQVEVENTNAFTQGRPSGK